MALRISIKGLGSCLEHRTNLSAHILLVLDAFCTQPILFFQLLPHKFNLLSSSEYLAALQNLMFGSDAQSTC